MVLVTGGLMATYVMLEAKKQGRPSEETFKSLWAIGAITLGLSVFADFVPKVAGPFALLVLAAMAARNTGALGGVIGGAAPKKQTATSTTRKVNGAARRPDTVRGGN